VIVTIIQEDVKLFLLRQWLYARSTSNFIIAQNAYNYSLNVYYWQAKNPHIARKSCGEVS